jgi:hypothetical protein
MRKEIVTHLQINVLAVAQEKGNERLTNLYREILLSQMFYAREGNRNRLPQELLTGIERQKRTTSAPSTKQLQAC